MTNSVDSVRRQLLAENMATDWKFQFEIQSIFYIIFIAANIGNLSIDHFVFILVCWQLKLPAYLGMNIWHHFDGESFN